MIALKGNQGCKSDQKYLWDLSQLSALKCGSRNLYLVLREINKNVSLMNVLKSNQGCL